jgi:hypothetical protein
VRAYGAKAHFTDQCDRASGQQDALQRPAGPNSADGRLVFGCSCVAAGVWYARGAPLLNDELRRCCASEVRGWLACCAHDSPGLRTFCVSWLQPATVSGFKRTPQQPCKHDESADLVGRMAALYPTTQTDRHFC